jgi:L-iditol 2-dehydrogenase
MRALVLHEAGRVAVEERPMPAAQPGEVVIRTAATGLCYSDVRVYKGEKHARAGVIPGHEVAGTVDHVGAGVTSLRAGDRVAVYPILACGHCRFCLSGLRQRCAERVTLGYDEDGGLAEFVRLPAALVALGHAMRAPDNLPLDRACLSEPVACVLNSIETCRVGAGSSLLVIGGGPMGLLHVILGKAAGATPIFVSEPEELRAAKARALDATVLNPNTDDIPAQISEHTGGVGADAVVVSAGLPDVLDDAIASVRRLGWVNLFAGFPPNTRVPFDPNQVHYSEVRLTGTQNASPDQFRRTLVQLERLPEIDSITTHRYELEDAAEAYEVRLRSEGLKTMVVADASVDR